MTRNEQRTRTFHHRATAMVSYLFRRTNPKSLATRNFTNTGFGPKNQEPYFSMVLPFTRKELAEWIRSQPAYKTCLETWTEAGYPLRLAPSIDRINSDLGYSFDNMEIVSFSENMSRASRKANENRKRRKAQDESNCRDQA